MIKGTKGYYCRFPIILVHIFFKPLKNITKEGAKRKIIRAENLPLLFIIIIIISSNQKCFIFWWKFGSSLPIN